MSQRARAFCSLKWRLKKDFVTHSTWWVSRIFSRRKCKSLDQLRSVTLVPLTHSVFEAFNNLKSIRSTNWELENGYASNAPNTYPYRISGSGENGGIKFEIWRNISEVKVSQSYNKGFKLVVHLPCEIPQFDKQYFRFPLEKSATLVVRPSLIDTDDLKSYDENTRQCVYEGERKLQFFKKYTRSNCQLECLALYTLKKCGCIHYSMPRFAYDKVCDSETSLGCFKKAKRLLMEKNMEISLRTSENYEDRGKLACDCLPSCTSLSYEGEISHDDIRYFKRTPNST